MGYMANLGPLAGIEFANAPGLLAYYEYPAEDYPGYVWSIRVFKDFDTGFKAHLAVPILLKIVSSVGILTDPGFPYGVSFSTEESIAGAIEVFPGNAVYDQYYYSSSLLGPAPDFGKGL